MSEQKQVTLSPEDQKLDRLVENILDTLGDEFEELTYDRDGPVDNAAWMKRWEQLEQRVDQFLNAIPVAPKAGSDA